MVINLEDLYFTNLSIHNTAGAFENVNMKISMEHSVNVDSENNSCDTKTSISIVPENSAELDGEFAIRISANTKFSLKNYTPLENKNLHVQTVQQVYPYIRAAVSNITALAGIPPIHMPFLNVSSS